MRPPLFVYGTLTFDPLFAALVGAAPDPREATLRDHRVERQADSDIPMLTLQEGAFASGLVRSGLTAAQWQRLDAYELPFGYDLRPVTVTYRDGTRGMVLAYFPAAGVMSSGQAWDKADWQARSAAVSVQVALELALHDPALEGASLVRQWPMLRMRASAQVRAGQTRGPATLRHAALPGEVTMVASRPLDGAFFKLAGTTLTHRQFDGNLSGPFPREVLIAADAALVLPYDPIRDRVLLVEQVRPGPARRGDPNPWSLEPVAGIIDAGEAPEDAARREAQEEANLDLTDLRLMFATYASPGSTTDYFYCFLGFADLPDNHPRRGGLIEENEDLRLHLLPFEDALALVDTGEATAGPLVAMLLWLYRYRANVQAALPSQGGTPRQG